MQSLTVIQMLKSPASTQVKTRLSPVLSLEERQQLHWQMVEAMATSIHDFSKASNCRGVLSVAGDLEVKPLVDLAKDLKLTLVPQQGEDLGARMWNALSHSLSTSDAAIVVGSDCPFIDVSYLQQAADALLSQDVVFGPATDGGYVLLGVKKHVPIFSDIDWGTELVLAQTIDRLKVHDVNYFALPELDDIDRPEDLRLLANEKLQSHFSEWVAEE